MITNSKLTIYHNDGLDVTTHFDIIMAMFGFLVEKEQVSTKDMTMLMMYK